MILVDTSVWIDHLRSPEPMLSGYLADELVLTHPFVIGEVALGNFKRRALLVELFENLNHVEKAQDEEVLSLIEKRKWFGTGLSLVDCHLLVSLQLSREAALWTRDKRFAELAREMGVVVIAETRH
jgi:predicted nucleic acid-binding protein